MAPLHETAMWLMIGSAITAAVCCLAVGRAIPWQGRQSAVVMALGMLALCAGGGDARIALLVVAAGIGSAVLGVAGLRGHGQAFDCFHRALGCVAMAVCAVVAAGGHAAGAGVAVAGHAAHAGVPFPLLAAGVVGLPVVLAVARPRHGTGPRGAFRRGRADGLSLRAAERAAMAVSLGAMGVLGLMV